ncbi:MAG: carbamoyltransferase HypF [Promethearchaeota archaeon]
MKRRAVIHVTGIVQGVGFRPFVYRLAVSHSLTGNVLNLGDAGVRVIVEGEKDKIQTFLKQIEKSPPSISRIDSIVVSWENPSDSFSSFDIKKSIETRTEGSTPVLPPDIAICEDCIKDLTSSDSRWYLYPFTSCAACGPRFSTITNLPYDRPNTTMIDFPLCDTCNTGYTNPLDRRYHAQTTACESCGPMYSLVDSFGNRIECNDPVLRISDLIEEGSIVAIQGIAGTHIVTKTSEEMPLQILRKRKKRSQRPFAIMVRNLSTARKIANVSEREEVLLTSWRRPIVLLQRKERTNSDVLSVIHDSVLDLIAPGLDTIGIMLPYAPVHHLLFRYSKEPAMVMTSANPPGLPMFIEPEVIVSELQDIVDYFLLHNRRIFQRADDSVIKPLPGDNQVFIRRARGYVPEPLPFEGPWKTVKVIALGPEEKATASVLTSERIYPTQHIGDINRVENLDFLSNAVNHMMKLLDIKKLNGIACDLHPEFLTTELAERLAAEQDVPLFRVQHHHAHLASMIVDRFLSFDTSIICITADGFGLGEDGNAWGGEVLLGNLRTFTREGGITSVEYPGGDLSAAYASRPALGLLRNHLNQKQLLKVLDKAPISPKTKMSNQTMDILFDTIDRGINTVTSTSAGRFLDAVALVLGVCSENSYDGECPMKLEAVARETTLKIDPEFVTNDGTINLDISKALVQILDLKKKGISRQEIAYAAQWYLGSSLAEIACNVAMQSGIDYIGFSGGVALNRIITKAVLDRVHQDKLQPLFHLNVPPGDGGISIGQVAVAGANLVEY